MNPVRIGVAGAAGKMGRALIRAVAANPQTQLSAAWERPGHPDLKRVAGELAGVGGQVNPVLVAGGPESLDRCDVILDFTAPEATVALARQLAKADHKLGMVVGTTGLSKEQLAELKQASQQLPVMYATNYSVGVNVLWMLARQTAKILGESFDVEIIEAHHNLKKDAPSGTALTLYEEVCQGLGLDAGQAARFGRSGQVGARSRQEVGLHAVRGGDIVGDHTVLFAGPGERLELKHQVHSRDTLAHGAVRAAAWLSGKPAGWYGMTEVLGLK